MTSKRRCTPHVVALVALGGALGASARYGIGVWVPDSSAGFPWTTFVINVVGSFLLATLPAISVVHRSARLRALLGPGALGGFTTLSTYSDQTRALHAAGSTGVAATYLVGTLAACLMAVAAADRLSSRTDRANFGAEGVGQ